MEQPLSLLLLLLLPLADGAMPFPLPFKSSSYTHGPLEALSGDAKDKTGAVLYWRWDEQNVHIGLAANGARWVGFGLNTKG